MERGSQQFVYIISEPECGHGAGQQMSLAEWSITNMGHIAMFLIINPSIDFVQWEEPTPGNHCRQHTFARKYEDGQMATSRR